jgi:hypothetical protein
MGMQTALYPRMSPTTNGRALDRPGLGPYSEIQMTSATRTWAWRRERGGSLRLH